MMRGVMNSMATPSEITEYLDAGVRPILESLVARANCEMWRPGHLYTLVDDVHEGKQDGMEWFGYSLHTRCDNCAKINQLGLSGAPCLALCLNAFVGAWESDWNALPMEPIWNVRADLMWSLPPDATDSCGFEGEGSCSYHFSGTAPCQDRERLMEKLSRICHNFETGLCRGYPPSASRFSAKLRVRKWVRFLRT